VAVIFSPPAPDRQLEPVPVAGLGRLDEGEGRESVEDLLGPLGIVSNPG
jgi:hypothetical protein